MQASLASVDSSPPVGGAIQEENQSLPDGISRAYLLHHQVCPQGLSADGDLIVIASPSAFLTSAIDDLGFIYSRPIRVEQRSASEVEQLIERISTRSDRELELRRPSTADDDITAADVRDLASQPPVVRYVNLLVRDAFDAQASDVHLEAVRSGLSVRFRIDGQLVTAPEPPAQLHHAIISRIKLLAELDIAERRRPQDGRIRVRLETRELDLRVSTVPTIHGESVVLRLLERGGRPVGLNELGMSAETLARVTRLAARPHGMILVTGPTGSGKTTTLYAAQAQRDASKEKIITVEDPIEYQLSGVTQVPVHRQAGVTFASALRSILRQDPDVVLVGEMRDQETAEIAVQAALTGHVVFSTLHTNDAVTAIPRLLDLGIADYLIAATVEGVLAQRLVRRICDSCRVAYRAAPNECGTLFGDSSSGLDLQRGTGCTACRGTGYRGRTGVFELLTLTDELRAAILRRASKAELTTIAAEADHGSLRSDCSAKVRAGVTTIEEAVRVLDG